jgi:hypothetical protein
VNAETWLRLALVPAAVWLASLAARRWGHTASGYLGGLPLIGGPITLFIALDYGAEFAARSATVTLAAILGQAAHLTVFAHVARRARWPAALAAGWASFAVVAFAVTVSPLTPVIALLLALAGLAAAWLLLPHPEEEATLPAVPRAEMHLRVGAAFVLAVIILWAAARFGPVVSGVLLSVPVTGSIMPPFTLALYGPDAVARLTRGFIVGLSGFTAFFFTLAAGVVSLGITAAFAAAVLVALATLYAASRLLPIAACK